MQNKFDVVGVSVIAGYYEYRKLLQISAAINKSKNSEIGDNFDEKSLSFEGSILEKIKNN